MVGLGFDLGLTMVGLRSRFVLKKHISCPDKDRLMSDIRTTVYPTLTSGRMIIGYCIRYSCQSKEINDLANIDQE